MCRDIYIDDSGSVNKGNGLLLLAGYVTTTARWLAFSDEWESALEHYGIEEMHMKELWDRKGDFDETRIPWCKKMKMVAHFDDIIRRRVEVGFCVSIFMEDYNAVLRGKLRVGHEPLHRKLDHPYCVLFSALVGGLAGR
jgi:hypothetical protein